MLSITQESTNGVAIEFQAALLKVASRCNLNCDYCYVYHHADQSWREQPHFISDDTIKAFAERLNEYVVLNKLTQFSVCFHGGEPLLFTPERLAHIAQTIRTIVELDCVLDFSLQTNGVLLNSNALKTLEEANISISLSLDGPKYANDLHRLDHAEKSTFDQTINALKLLKTAKKGIFRGVICVIDPNIPPRDLFEFFHSLELPQLDLLLPDATHGTRPLGRTQHPELYTSWLESAFRLWFSAYPNIPIRWFDAILGSRLGLPSPTDAMGPGSVSLVVIETDGSYTDHDVFKITKPGGALLERTVYNTSLEEIAHHSNIKAHNHRLTIEGLAKECKTCPVVEACGGGSVMHRFHPERGLDAPTVYCREIFTVLTTATKLLRQSLQQTTTGTSQNFPNDKDLEIECIRWRQNTETMADAIIEAIGSKRYKISAASIFLRQSLGWPIGSKPSPSDEYSSDPLWLGSIKLQSQDPWLVIPFASTVKMLPISSVQAKHGIASLDAIKSYISLFNPHILNAISTLITDLLFVETTDPNEKGIFSFSDDKAPNVLYIASYAGEHPLSPEDLADSILHEFFHQVLHHVEQTGPLLLDKRFPRFPAPWRAGLRSAGGFLHGTFVFSGLSRYWSALADSHVADIDHEKAADNAKTFRNQALYGIGSLREFALLTERGLSLLSHLESQMGVTTEPFLPPGYLLT